MQAITSSAKGRNSVCLLTLARLVNMIRTKCQLEIPIESAQALILQVRDRGHNCPEVRQPRAHYTEGFVYKRNKLKRSLAIFINQCCCVISHHATDNTSSPMFTSLRLLLSIIFFPPNVVGTSCMSLVSFI